MMNRIILIGNGFDLAHGLKTSYKDFIEDYWILILNPSGFRQKMLKILVRTKPYNDALLSIKMSIFTNQLIPLFLF